MDVSFEKTHSAYMLFYEHVSVSDIDQPPRRLKLQQELQDWIWEDNVQFLRDKLIFDIGYFNFMWQFCHSIPKTIGTKHSVNYLSIKLAASFLLETLVHSREKPHMKTWMEMLLGGLEKCHAACEWLLDSMGGDDWWLQQLFIKCPAQPLRQVIVPPVSSQLFLNYLLLLGLSLHFISFCIFREGFFSALLIIMGPPLEY